MKQGVDIAGSTFGANVAAGITQVLASYRATKARTYLHVWHGLRGFAN